MIKVKFKLNIFVQSKTGQIWGDNLITYKLERVTLGTVTVSNRTGMAIYILTGCSMIIGQS